MTNYYRLMLGKGSIFASECISGNFIGADFGIHQDLTGRLPDDMRAFNRAFIPVFFQTNPGITSRISAGLSCGALWTIAKGIKINDVVLCPDGAGHYYAGVVDGDYTYQPGSILPHRRSVRWKPQTIDRAAMSDELKRSTGSIGTVSDITDYHDEIERLLSAVPLSVITAADDAVEDPAVFTMESYLEKFLVDNWANTLLGKEYDIYQDEDNRPGQQFPTDTGPMDILAISKDKKTLLVVELKRSRASDAVVGQILRYMGYVDDVLTKDGQQVKGTIIALDDDQRIRRALAMTPGIDFYRYEVSFKLSKMTKG